jgi:hypothetical protein
MSFLKKLGSALVPGRSSIKSVVQNIPTSRADISNAIRNPASTLRTGAQIGRDQINFGIGGLKNAGTVAETGFKASNQIAKNGLDVGIQGLRMGRDLGGNAIDLAKNGLTSGTQFAIGRPNEAIKTIKAGAPIAAQGLGMVKSGLQNSTNAGMNGMGVKLGNALGGSPASSSIGQAAMSYQQPEQQSYAQPVQQQQQAFAPQMQMPMNQGMPQRVQSGIQFGSQPNPIQQPQMQQPHQQMPVFNSGPVPQYGQQNAQPRYNMGMPPNTVDGVPMNRAVNAPTEQDRRAVMDMGRRYI